MNSKISIVDLEVFYRVGVPDEERTLPQRLLLTIEMESDFSAAAKTDSIADTIDYFAVSQQLLKFGDGKMPWIDHQHPHDLFMELAASYSVPINDDSSVFAYFGYPGEPALSRNDSA